MVINSPCLTDKKELAIPGQTTTGKESSNPLMADSLPKTILPTKSEIVLEQPIEPPLSEGMDMSNITRNQSKTDTRTDEKKKKVIKKLKKSKPKPERSCLSLLQSTAA
ncbi:hypothetical protein Tco_1541439 [Tanacetum coccineum]